VTVGYTEGAVHAGVLPLAVRRMRAKHPDVTITLNATRSGRQIEAVRHREIDVGFVYTPPDGRDPDVVHALVFDDPLVSAVPAADSLAKQKIAAPKDLDGRAWIGSSRYTDATKDKFLAACKVRVHTRHCLRGRRAPHHAWTCRGGAWYHVDPGEPTIIEAARDSLCRSAVVSSVGHNLCRQAAFGSTPPHTDPISSRPASSSLERILWSDTFFK